MPGLPPEASHQIRLAERKLATLEERRKLLLDKAGRGARLLRTEFGVTRVWLFGSLRRAWFHERSDIDLAVEGLAADQHGSAWDRLVEVLDEDVDLVRMEEADEGLRRRILDSGGSIDDGETARQR